MAMAIQNQNILEKNITRQADYNTSNNNNNNMEDSSSQVSPLQCGSVPPNPYYDPRCEFQPFIPPLEITIIVKHEIPEWIRLEDEEPSPCIPTTATTTTAATTNNTPAVVSTSNDSEQEEERLLLSSPTPSRSFLSPKRLFKAATFSLTSKKNTLNHHHRDTVALQQQQSPPLLLKSASYHCCKKSSRQQQLQRQSGHVRRVSGVSNTPSLTSLRTSPTEEESISTGTVFLGVDNNDELILLSNHYSTKAQYHSHHLRTDFKQNIGKLPLCNNDSLDLYPSEGGCFT